MYIPDYTRIDDPKAIEKVVAENGLATLVTASSGGVKATHLPLLYSPSSEGGEIAGHMAKANDHWRVLEEAEESLAIFQGPDAYISPEWYETAPAVPTWNFAVVHMRGPVELVHDTTWLSDHVDEMVLFHESRTLDHPPQAPDPDLRNALLHGIVGFRMTVLTVEAKFKLSQNRSDADRISAARGLEASGGRHAGDIARLMRNRGGD